MPFLGSKRRVGIAVYIYVLKNIRNGKKYVGVSHQPETRFKQHISCAKARRGGDGHLYRAIRKWGAECFTMRVIKRCDSRAEAFSEEIRMIKKLRPEYNSTFGGDGRLGLALSAEGKARIAVANKGNKYRLGIPHTEQVKELLRGLNQRPAAIKRWKEFAKMGSAAMARPVMCLTDGAHFPSASAAARAYEVPKSAVIEICNKKKYRKTIGGRSFEYLHEGSA